MKKAFSKLRKLFTRHSSSPPVVAAGGSAPVLSQHIDLVAPQILMMSLTQTSSSTYTIKSGDTFTSIATQLGTTVAILEQANPSVDPNNLKAGGIIQLQPAGSEYTVQAGDTFNSIAAKSNLIAAVLEAANPSINPTNLVVGSQILIPPSTPVPVVSTPPANPAPITYTIQTGDTFNLIAKSLGVTEAALEAANPALNINNLQVGSQIIIPAIAEPSTTVLISSPTPTPTTPAPSSSSTYIIQAGDTFNLIAGKLGTTAAVIEGLNPSVNPNALQIGAQILLPLSNTQPASTQTPEPVPTPVTVPAPLPTPAPTPTLIGTYIIQAGDTFSSIAAKEGTTVALLEAASK